MPNVTPLQSDFSVGELAPDMQVRSTFDQRNRATLTMQNFIPDSRGPASRRQGFRFLGKVGLVGGAECAQGTLIDSGEDPGYSLDKNIFNIDYSETQNVIIVSGSQFNNNGRGIIGVNPDTKQVFWWYTSCTRSGHKIISREGTQDRSLVAWIEWVCGGTDSNRLFHVKDMADNFTTLTQTSLGTTNSKILGERDQDVLLWEGRTNNDYILIDKATWGYTQLQNTVGWTPTTFAAAINPAGGIPDRYLICEYDGANQFAFGVYQSGGTFAAPTVNLGNIGGTVSECKTNPVVVGNDIWWMFTTLETDGRPRQWLVRTDYAGNLQESVPKYDDQTILNTRTGYDQLWYEASNNSLYYLYEDTLWRYDISAQTYHTCVAPYPEGISIIDGRSSSMIRVNGLHWNAFLRYNTDHWGVEYIEAFF